MSETSSGCFGCVHLVGLWSTEQHKNKVEMFVQHTLLQVLFAPPRTTVITSIIFLMVFYVRTIKRPSCSFSCSFSPLKPKYFCCCGMWSICTYLTCIFLTLQRACENLWPWLPSCDCVSVACLLPQLLKTLQRCRCQALCIFGETKPTDLPRKPM